MARQADKSYRVCYLLGMRASVEHFLGRPGKTAELEAAREAYPAYRDTLLLDFTAQMAWQSGDLQATVATYRDQVAWDGGLSSRRAFGESMAVMALAELGQHREAARIQQAGQAAFHGRRCWVLSRLVDWSGAVAVALAGDEPEGMRRLASVAEDTIDHGYWIWGRWMAVDLAEMAAYAGDGPAVAGAADLLRADPWPPGGPSHDAARAFVSGAQVMLSDTPEDAVGWLEQAAGAFGSAGWPLFEARALGLLGTALIRHDRPRADRDPADRSRTLLGVRRGRAPRTGPGCPDEPGHQRTSKKVGPGWSRIAQRP